MKIYWFGLFVVFLYLAPCVDAQQAREPHELRVAGLHGPVTIRRDERGIPYIEAIHESDLYFGQGYATASDRLWQMDLLRRTPRGELSEIFGRVTLEEDKRRRIYGFAAISEKAAAGLSPRTRLVVEAYAKGVNAFIKSRTEKMLPPEFQLLGYKPRPWTVADSLVIGENFAETLSTSWMTDLARATLSDLDPEKRKYLLPETSPLDVLIVGSDKTNKRRGPRPILMSGADPHQMFGALSEARAVMETMARSLERIGLYAEDRAASNNWVVSGRHTASQRPLLANDPHLRGSAPSIWYMTHLAAPGLRVAGVTAPGLPGIIIGHNERISWGITNLGADVQDIYLEKFDSENNRRYQTPTGWQEAEVRREEIKVRKSFTDTATETVNLDVTVTRNGPVIFEAGPNRYSLRWTALDPHFLELQSFYALNRARNWNEFRAALRGYDGPSQNFVYADVDGHIGYYGAGKIPIRKTGDGSLPYDGSTNAGEWTGFIPFDKLPHAYDPPSGMIVTANSRIVGQSYPFHLTNEWATPYRARRILDLLTAKRKLTIDDFRRIQGDTYSITGVRFARQIIEIATQAKSTANDDKWRETIRLLEAWDGRMDADSRGALMTSEIRERFRQRILTTALGEERAGKFRWGNTGTFLDRVIAERPRAWLPAEFKHYGELLETCVIEARENLAKRLGADETNWTWGHETKVRFPHPLAAIPLVGGRFAISSFPQNGSAFNLSTINVGTGVSMRFIADPGDWNRSQQGIALGQSGDPSSPHWQDQLTDWRAVAPRGFPFTKLAIEGATKEKIMLAPQ